MTLPRADPIFDDPFHAAAFSAFVTEARAVQGWPDREKARQRAYRIFEDEKRKVDGPKDLR